jgi:hypothetical protein
VFCVTIFNLIERNQIENVVKTLRTGHSTQRETLFPIALQIVPTFLRSIFIFQTVILYPISKR